MTYYRGNYMKTEHITYILEVARCLSISSAAKKLYISQTTLSSIVTNFEKELSITVFTRTTKGVKLTPHGENIIAKLHDLENAYDFLLNTNNEKDSIKKLLHLLVYPSASNSLCIHLSKSIANLYPDIILNNLKVNPKKVFPQMLEGAAGVAVNSDNCINFESSKILAKKYGFELDILCYDKFYLCVNSNSKFACRESIDISELSNEKRVATDHFPTANDSHFGKIFTTVPLSAIFTSNEIMKMAIANQDVIAFVTGLSLYGDPYIKSKEIIKINLTGFLEENRLITYILHRPFSELNNVECYMINQIKEFYQQFQIL